MNITPQSYNLPIQTTVNLQTDSLRRENQQREIITKPEASSQSAAEKGVASDKERGRTPAQNNEQVDFTSLRKQAEQASASINGDDGNASGNEDPQQNAQDNSAENNNEENTANNSSENAGSAENDGKSDTEVFAEKQVIRELESRDKEVRTHEMAHAAVGGAFTGSPSYTFQIGPDGKKYAVEGEVSVDLTPVAGDPKETIAKMKKVQAAALAPAQPSAQDVRVAASASNIILEAQAELLKVSSEEAEAKSAPSNLYRDKAKLQDDENSLSNESSAEFDRHMEHTLSSQEMIAPSRSLEIDERAGRIEQFYSNINQAYEKQASHQFELTA